MINENFSKMAHFISELRKEKKLTQKELAEQLGVTDKAVSKWERGLSCPDISLLSKLSRLLGVTTSELLNGEKAEPSAPEVDTIVETTLQYADTATKSVIAKSARWKYVAIIVSVITLLGILVLMLQYGNQVGLAWSILPLGITEFVWLTVILGVFVMGKNKITSLLLCGFFIFITTVYYSSLKTPTRDISTFGGFNGFQNDYIPHYTIILIMFIVSIALATVSFLIQNKKTSGDNVFLLVAVNITIVILSVLTESSIMDYVDINGLGVNPKFTILMLLMVLINYVSLALMARRHKRQIAGTQKADSN
jgi:transcriptional regulator with XRE-family HTH domain